MIEFNLFREKKSSRAAALDVIVLRGSRHRFQEQVEQLNDWNDWHLSDRPKRLEHFERLERLEPSA